MHLISYKQGLVEILNVYATNRSSGVNMESIRPLDWCNVTYGDYLFALDCDIEQLKKQIKALIECCFNINKYSK